MQISSHCFAVTGLGYVCPWCVNAGFVAGETTTLVIDTGGNWMAAQTIHGYAFAVRPENQIMVVNTQKHFDHVSGNGFFRSLGIDVCGHAENLRTGAEFADDIEEFNDAINRCLPPSAQKRPMRSFTKPNWLPRTGRYMKKPPSIWAE